MPKFVIDDRYEDVDFPTEAPFVFGDCGVPAYDQEQFGAYEDSVQTLSQSRLREVAERQEEHGGLENLMARVFDQYREGSCVSQACAQAAELNQSKQHGKENVVSLSAISLYKQIGRSASSGATVSSGMRRMSATGILPLDTPENRAEFGDHVMPNVGFGERYPDNWQETAARFQSLETHVIRSVDGILTALARQEPVVVGRQGHWICYVRPIWDGGWKVLYANSWGEDWGQAAGDFAGGFGIDTIRNIQRSAGWAFAVRSVRGRSV